MDLFGFTLKRKRRKKGPRKRSNKWLNQQAKTPETKEMVDNMTKESPMLLAAVISSVTGINLNTKDIKVPTAFDKMMAEHVEKKIEKLDEDEDFKQNAKYALIDYLYNLRGPGRPLFSSGQGHFHNYYPEEGDNI